MLQCHSSQVLAVPIVKQQLIVYTCLIDCHYTVYRAAAVSAQVVKIVAMHNPWC